MLPATLRLRPTGTHVLVFSADLFIFPLALTRITNYDIWHHLALGRHVLQSGLGGMDPFVYTQPDAPL